MLYIYIQYRVTLGRAINQLFSTRVGIISARKQWSYVDDSHSQPTALSELKFLLTAPTLNKVYFNLLYLHYVKHLYLFESAYSLALRY